MTIYNQASSELARALLKPIKPFTLEYITSTDPLEKLKLEELLNIKKQIEINRSVPLKNYHVLNWNWMNGACECCPMSKSNAIVSNDRKSICLHPFCNSCFETNAARMDQPLKSNAYTYWEISLSESQGTSVMIGIGTQRAKMNSNGYLNLIGIDKESWGVSNKGFLWYNNQSVPYCEQFSGKCTIGCLFDGYNGRLAFFKNGTFMGMAFSNIPVGKNADFYYPMVSSTVTKSIFKLEFVCESFPSLQDICKRELVSQQSANINHLPKSMINYLNN